MWVGNKSLQKVQWRDMNVWIVADDLAVSEDWECTGIWSIPLFADCWGELMGLKKEGRRSTVAQTTT